MKNKKDIFDLFRENEHKLDERPDGKLWDRLEGRLDQSAGPRVASRNGFRRWMSLAGVLLVLVVAVWGVNIALENRTPGDLYAEAKTVAMPLELEEIGVYSDNETYTVAEYQKILSRLNTSPILEGDPSKKIRIQKNVFASMSERSKQYIASVNDMLETEKQLSQASEANNKSEVNTTTGYTNVDANNDGEGAIALNDVMGSSSADKLDGVRLESDEDEMAGEMNPVEIAETEVKDVAVTSAPATAAPPGAEYEYGADDMETEADMAMEEVAILNTRTNDISVAANSAQVGIQQFQWLLGQWEAPVTPTYADAGYDVRAESAKPSRKSKESARKAKKQQAKPASNRSVEEWKPLDDFTIEGKGYLVVNGDTTFTEKMQIKNIGTDLYYVLALDNSGKTVQYKLKTYTQEGAIFENNEVAFPNQVILQRDLNNRNFTTLLQNAAPAQINNEQQQYFQQRNYIKSEQIKRVMNRVNE